MNKCLIQFCILMGSFCSTACASPQPLYGFKISLHNACTYPVQIAVFHFRLKGISLNETLTMEELLNPNESTRVFHGVYGSLEIKHALPDDYRLEISANGKTLSLNKTQFLEILKKSDYSRENCGIFCTSNTFLGTISDPSLCP